MAFQIKGLDPQPFAHLFGKSDDELKEMGISRYKVDSSPGYPDRVSLRDLDVGESALLLNYEHLPVQSPYRSRHAIFVHEGAGKPGHFFNKVPDVLKSRTVALRAFDRHDHIIEAELSEGEGIEQAIRRMFDNPDSVYIHAHFAARGCFAALIERSD
ncbi:MAG: DUF1203 domain-containing protein [Cohaesibacter sp.]|nr:DUF1203 domain-containing protein [Cohaesibacter sp.]